MSSTLKIKVALLQIGERIHWLNALEAILESSDSHQIELSRKRIDCGRADSQTEWVAASRPAVVFAALKASDATHAANFFQALRQRACPAPIVVMVQGGDPSSLLSLLESGAADFITPPPSASDVLPRFWRLIRDSGPDQRLLLDIKEKLGLRRLVGESPNFLKEMNKIPLLAKCDSSVLIFGETGTGKELAARAIHYLSLRASKPFVPVNCSAIPADLVENELFGHERGAFTGAVSAQAGLISEADGGTVFLDEVDCIPLNVQAKLLRFLQEKEFRVLGSPRLRRADVRIIAATNQPLQEHLKNGTFREDLFYRLNVLPLHLPPLRKRHQDVVLLARYFLEKQARATGQALKRLSAEGAQKLLLYNWPGNVRELENVIESASILCQSSILLPADLNLSLPGESLPESFRQAKKRVVRRFERKYIQGLLHAYGGNISRAARAARKNRRAFWELIRKHQIDVQQFKSPA